jgi:NADH-quinone oxidoreductase subunit A
MLLSGLSRYIPVLVFMVLAGVIGFSMLYLGILWRPKRPYKEKLSPYECGIEPFGDARERVVPRYYVYAMLFLAFDVEALFLFPWAIVFDKLGVFALVEMVLFIFILLIGLIYAWAKGALDWRY